MQKPSCSPSNKAIAAVLERLAGLLEERNENPHRIRSYRNAAEEVRNTPDSVATRALEGRLSGISGIGRKLEAVVREFVESGRIAALEDLEGDASGPAVSRPGTRHEPPVSLLLDLDREYRRKAADGSLRRIAPRLNNPEGKAWLPIMRAERQGYRFTALFSNTARAHELGKTDDWTVIYYEKGDAKGQCTVVTESRGRMRGRRVIRDREAECADHYGENSPEGA